MITIIDYKSGNYFDITGRGIITNYTVVTDGEGFVNGVYQVESTSAKTYHIVCLEDESGNTLIGTQKGVLRGNISVPDGETRTFKVIVTSLFLSTLADAGGLIVKSPNILNITDLLEEL